MIDLVLVVVTAFMSLDGVMEAPGGEPGHRSSGWTVKDIPFDPAVYEIKGREQEEASALLMGRRSYERAGMAWQDRGVRRLQRHARCVVSTTLGEEDPRWPATILRSLDEVAALKGSDGGPIIVRGNATLGQGLADAGLVDRYHLLIYLLLLGAGKRSFSDTDKDKQRLDIRESKTYGNGIPQARRRRPALSRCGRGTFTAPTTRLTRVTRDRQERQKGGRRAKGQTGDVRAG